jgi:translation initiation factor 4A
MNNIESKPTTPISNSQNDNPKQEPEQLEQAFARNDDVEELNNFDDMSLDDKLLHGVYSIGFLRPSPVQAKAIKPLKNGFDVIAQAQSGTGKTGAFVIGTLARLEAEMAAGEIAPTSGPVILALEPVRELARQTADAFADIGKYMDLRVCCCIGGTSMQEARANAKRAHVIVATPGRIIDMVRRGWVSLASVRTLVLDEADEMLSTGFQEDMRWIVEAIPRTCQVAVFSATFSSETFEVTRLFVKPDAVNVLVKRDQLTLAGIDQFYVAVDRETDKFDVLLDLFADLSIGQSVVFCNSRARVDELCRRLEEHDFTPAALHAEIEQSERNAVLEKVRQGQARVLVTSNVMARGIDVTGVSCVFNFDLPRDVAVYLHRIGRAGRFGKKGVAINLVAANDVALLRNIERHYDTRVAELPADYSQRLRNIQQTLNN